MYRPFTSFSLPTGITSVIGSGGKTSFLRYFAAQLQGTVILTTSTHIFPFSEIPLVSAMNGSGTENLSEVLRRKLELHRVVCLGDRLPSGKLSAPAWISFEEMASLADYVLIEADGSAGRPLKAHRPWEPVIPPGTRLTVCVIGASGIGQPADRVCHCPELFCSLADHSPVDPVSIESIARVINQEDLADWCFINQTDTQPDPSVIFRLCDLLRMDTCAGSLRTDCFFQDICS